MLFSSIFFIHVTLADVCIFFSKLLLKYQNSRPLVFALLFCLAIYKINDNFHSHPCVFFACLGKNQVLSTWHVFLKLRIIKILVSLIPRSINPPYFGIIALYKEQRMIILLYCQVSLDQ